MSIDMFLKVDGLDGESADQKHAKWIGVLSFNHQVSQAAAKETGTGGRTRRGAADFQNLEVVKYLDAATPDLNVWCANGERIKKVKLELCEPGGEHRPYMRYVLENASIMSVAPSGTSADGFRPLETVTFSYARITWEYTPFDGIGRPGTPIVRSWDLTTGKPE